MRASLYFLPHVLVRLLMELTSTLQGTPLSRATTWRRTFNFRYRLAAQDPTFKATLWSYDPSIDDARDRWMVDATVRCCLVTRVPLTRLTAVDSRTKGNRSQRTARSARCERTLLRLSAPPRCMTLRGRHGCSCRSTCAANFVHPGSHTALTPTFAARRLRWRGLGRSRSRVGGEGARALDPGLGRTGSRPPRAQGKTVRGPASRLPQSAF